MFNIRELQKVHSIQEAKELNSKRINTVIGGGLWLRLGKRKIGTAIDLSGLGLEGIEENDKEFKIGAMTSLREIETCKSLNDYFQNSFKEALKGIVGVQFRNGATIGGSVYSRFGFSDVVSLLLALDAYVVLDEGEKVQIKEYTKQDKDNKIVTHIIIPKLGQKVYYSTFRRESVDIPMLNGAVSLYPDGKLYCIIGSRPQIAALHEESTLPKQEEVDKFVDKVLADMTFLSNTRASAEYRKSLAKVILINGIKKLATDAEVNTWK